MSRSRRQPPLFEFLGGSERRSEAAPNAVSAGSGSVASSGNPTSGQGSSPRPGAPPALRLTKPEAESPGAYQGSDRGHASSASSSIGSWAGAMGSQGDVGAPPQRRWLSGFMLAVSGLVLVVTMVAVLMYRLGSRDEAAKLLPYIQPQGTAGLAGPSSQSPLSVGTAPLPSSLPPAEELPSSGNLSGSLGSGLGSRTSEPTPAPRPSKLQSVPAPTAASAARSNVETRQAGTNYLVLATLTHKDAVQAVEYLGKQGVRAGLAPAQKKLDPSKAAANNVPHVVFVLDGVASDRFKSSERERQLLVTKVEQVGKRWVREERGASDFSRPQWTKYAD